MKGYQLFVKVFSLFPENIYDELEFLFSSVKYGKYINRVRKELLQADNEDYKEFAKQMPKFFFRKYTHPDWLKKYKNKNIKIMKDENGPYYVYGSRRMYLPAGWNKTRCAAYIRALIAEQDKESYHLYLTPELKKKDYGVVIDIGGAEGIFSLDIIDQCEKLYVFEYDKKWIETLRNTFRKEIEIGKVEIISRYVSNRESVSQTSLDKWFGDEIPANIDLIKMDIEGAEQEALQGMRRLLIKNPNATLLICVYHSQNAEQEIRELLKGYRIFVRNGYVLITNMDAGIYPYIRHGVIEAKR